MGTSKAFGGPRTGLVPSWVDDPAPGGQLPPAGTAGPGTSAPGSPPAPAPVAPGRPDASGAGGFGAARGAFSRFARTGDRSALGRSLSRHVRDGNGGARRAARRMGASRVAGGRLLGVLRDVQRYGPAEALRRLDLPGFAGRPAADVFPALLEFVCPPGGALDEAIARQAMLQAVGELADAGLGSFDGLTADQLQEFFLGFIGHSIEGRVMADIGQRGMTLPDDVAAVESAQEQLHDFVAGCVRGALLGRLDGLAGLSDRDAERVVGEIYEAAFDLIAAAAEAAAGA